MYLAHQSPDRAFSLEYFWWWWRIPKKECLPFNRRRHCANKFLEIKSRLASQGVNGRGIGGT
jgi:hypothetical protein